MRCTNTYRSPVEVHTVPHASYVLLLVLLATVDCLALRSFIFSTLAWTASWSSFSLSSTAIATFFLPPAVLLDVERKDSDSGVVAEDLPFPLREDLEGASSTTCSSTSINGSFLVALPDLDGFDFVGDDSSGIEIAGRGGDDLIISTVFPDSVSILRLTPPRADRADLEVSLLPLLALERDFVDRVDLAGDGGTSAPSTVLTPRRSSSSGACVDGCLDGLRARDGFDDASRSALALLLARVDRDGAGFRPLVDARDLMDCTSAGSKPSSMLSSPSNASSSGSASIRSMPSKAGVGGAILVRIISFTPTKLGVGATAETFITSLTPEKAGVIWSRFDGANSSRIPVKFGVFGGARGRSISLRPAKERLGGTDGDVERLRGVSSSSSTSPESLPASAPSSSPPEVPWDPEAFGELSKDGTSEPDAGSAAGVRGSINLKLDGPGRGLTAVKLILVASVGRGAGVSNMLVEELKP